MARHIYLIHFDPAYKHARHYLDSTTDLPRRLAEHRAGAGSRLCQVAAAAGCQIVLVRIWRNRTRKFERRLKNRHDRVPIGRALCPICNPTRTTKHATARLEKIQLAQLTELAF